MPHDTSLIGTVVAGLGVAFLMGALAHRLKISPIAGYLLAGVLVGPFTPGFVADTGLALQLAEIGVILLMFGVGLHFSLKDLLSVRKIAVPGAIAQIAVATALGMMLGLWLGWSIEGSAVFGLALSVASTVVLLRALQSLDMVETEKGRIAVGWLIVEDLVMVLALVLLPAMFGDRGDEANGAGLLQSAGSCCSRSSASSLSCSSSRGGCCRGCCTGSRIRGRANCSASRCWRSRWAWRSARR
jgi:CPA2 family monovalent cation:H+ antiporter-2